MAIGKPDWNYGRGRFVDPVGDFATSLGSFANRLVQQEAQKKADARYADEQAYQRSRQAKADARQEKLDKEREALKTSQDAYMKGLLSGRKDLRGGLLTDTIAADPTKQKMLNEVTLTPAEMLAHKQANLAPTSPDAVALANQQQPLVQKPVFTPPTSVVPSNIMSSGFDPAASAMGMAQGTAPVLTNPLAQPTEPKFDPNIVKSTQEYQSAVDKLQKQEVLGQQLAQTATDLANAPADVYSETRTQQLERVGKEMVDKGIIPPPQYLKDLETSREADRQVRLTTYKNNETQLNKLSESANKLKLDVAKLDDKSGNTTFTPKDVTSSANALETYMDKALKDLDIDYDKKREAKEAAATIYQNLVKDGMHPSTAQLIAQRSIAIEPGMLWFDDKATLDPTKVAQLKGQFASLGGAGAKGSNERTQLVDMYAQNIAQQNAIKKEQAGFGRTPEQNLYNKTGELINKNVEAPTPLKTSLKSIMNPEASDKGLQKAVEDWTYDPNAPVQPTSAAPVKDSAEPFTTEVRDGKEVRVLNPKAGFKEIPEEPGLYDASLDMIPGTLAGKQILKTTGKATGEIAKEAAKVAKEGMAKRAIRSAQKKATEKLRTKAAEGTLTQAAKKSSPLQKVPKAKTGPLTSLKEKRANLLTEKFKLERQLKNKNVKGRKAIQNRVDELSTQLKAY